MLTINFENLHKISTHHGLTIGEIEKEFLLIEKFNDNIKEKKQGFLNLPDDDTLNKIESYTLTQKTKYNKIIVLGIGGSALGTSFLKQSLTHLFKPTHPTLEILDNIDPTLIKELTETLDLKTTLFIVVSKSGTTPETISQYFYFQSLIKKANLTEKEHFIFITDKEKGFLNKINKNKEITTFTIPKNTGGRFSILTPVSLVPSSFININIRNLIKGAEKQIKTITQTDTNNTSFLLATISYLLYKKHKTINTLMPYSQKLIKFTEWYKQLLSESIGKKYDNEENKVNIGITPLNTVGATDQHSILQLFNEGPNDKLITLIKIKETNNDIEIPMPYDEEELNYLKNTTFKKLLDTEMKGVEEALTKNGRPNITITLEKLDEENLGELIILFETMIAYLGEFFNINAFNQPGVELSKQITKKLLLNQQ